MIEILFNIFVFFIFMMLFFLKLYFVIVSFWFLIIKFYFSSHNHNYRGSICRRFKVITPHHKCKDVFFFNYKFSYIFKRYYHNSSFLSNSQDFLLTMRVFNTIYVFDDDKYFQSDEGAIIIVSSTHGMGYMGAPGIKYETIFLDDNRDIINCKFYLFRNTSSYDICLFNKNSEIVIDHCFYVDVLFFNSLDADVKLGYICIKFIILKVPHFDFNLNLFSHVYNSRYYYFCKSIFCLCFSDSYFYLRVIFFNHKYSFYFFLTTISVVHYSLNCEFLQRNDKIFISLSNCVDFNFNIDSYFYLSNFYISVNFFSYFNSYLKYKCKYKFLLGNKGGAYDFSGFKLLQFNHKSTLSKVVYFVSGCLFFNSYYSRFFSSKFKRYVFFNYSVVRFCCIDGYVRGIFKKDCAGRTFKYSIMDSSYYKHNAGKKEVVLEVTPDSVFLYKLYCVNINSKPCPVGIKRVKKRL